MSRKINSGWTEEQTGQLMSLLDEADLRGAAALVSDFPEVGISEFGKRKTTLARLDAALRADRSLAEYLASIAGDYRPGMFALGLYCIKSVSPLPGDLIAEVLRRLYAQMLGGEFPRKRGLARFGSLMRVVWKSPSIEVYRELNRLLTREAFLELRSSPLYRNPLMLMLEECAEDGASIEAADDSGEDGEDAEDWADAANLYSQMHEQAMDREFRYARRDLAKMIAAGVLSGRKINPAFEMMLGLEEQLGQPRASEVFKWTAEQIIPSMTRIGISSSVYSLEPTELIMFSVDERVTRLYCHKLIYDFGASLFLDELARALVRAYVAIAINRGISGKIRMVERWLRVLDRCRSFCPDEDWTAVRAKWRGDGGFEFLQIFKPRTNLDSMRAELCAAIEAANVSDGSTPLSDKRDRVLAEIAAGKDISFNWGPPE